MHGNGARLEDLERIPAPGQGGRQYVYFVKRALTLRLHTSSIPPRELM